MTESPDPSQRASRPIVAFDFDGTLTTRDSFMAFLAWRRSALRVAWGLARLAPAAAAWLADRDRGRLKAAAAREFLQGLPRVELDRRAEAFADATAPHLLRRDALDCWADWGRRGALRVIVTASPAPIVAPFARRLEADRLIGTELAYDADDRVTGDFAGPNCRGPEKVVRLRRQFGDDLSLAAAYGDTGGDREMLALAQEPGFRTFRAGPA